MAAMTLEQQVSNKELSSRLRDLGVKQESIFHWAQYHTSKEWDIFWNVENSNHIDLSTAISAFTVAELGEMLPKVIKERITETFGTNLQYAFNIHGQPLVEYKGVYDKTRKIRIPETYADTEADARAKMLIYLIENKLTTL